LAALDAQTECAKLMMRQACA